MFARSLDCFVSSTCVEIEMIKGNSSNKCSSRGLGTGLLIGDD